MALPKRSHRTGETISAFLHNFRFQSHKDKLEKEAESKRRNREKIVQRRELARNKQKHDNIVGRLQSEGIDARWVGEAILIMDEYGYGLAQVRRRVVPLLKSRIEQLLIENNRQNTAASRLSQAITLQVEVLKEMTGGTDTKDGDHG